MLGLLFLLLAQSEETLFIIEYDHSQIELLSQELDGAPVVDGFSLILAQDCLDYAYRNHGASRSLNDYNVQFSQEAGSISIVFWRKAARSVTSGEYILREGSFGCDAEFSAEADAENPLGYYSIH